MHDLIIKGGKIVDGTGAGAFTGDIAIDGGIISDPPRVHQSTMSFSEKTPSSWERTSGGLRQNCGLERTSQL